MAENRWISTSSVDWSVTDNWSLGHIPLDNEDVVLGGVGTASITAGFPTDAAAPAVNSFHRHKDYLGNVGESGTPLVLATVAATDPVNPFDPAGKVIVEGPGEFFYINGVGGAAQTTDQMYIDTDTQDTAIEVSGVINQLSLIKGRVVGLSGYDPARIMVGYRTNPATDAHLTLQGSAGVGSIMQQGGTVINTGSATISLLDISGGTFDHGRSAGLTQTITQTGGVFIHKSANTIQLAKILGGTFDCSQDVRAKTIVLLFVLTGAIFKPNAHITINTGGSILPYAPIAPGAF